MTVLLTRAYGAYQAGQVVELPASTEAALIAQNLATVSVATPTTGAISSNEFQGAAALAIGTSSVVVTNPNCNASSKVVAYVAQAAADGTALRVERVVPANGSFTIYCTANATAITVLEWMIQSAGMTPNQ